MDSILELDGGILVLFNRYLVHDEDRRLRKGANINLYNVHPIIYKGTLKARH
jgi:hypothetical protein